MNQEAAFVVPSVCDKGQWPPDYVAVYGWRQKQLMAMRSSPKLLLGAKAYYKTRPVEFICHWVDTYDPRKNKPGDLRKMPLVLFERQAELIEFFAALLEHETGGLVEKCRDMGATWLACAFSVWCWLFLDGAAVGWGSRKADLVHKIGDPDSIFEKMLIILRNMPPEFLPVGFDAGKDSSYMKLINRENGATITGESGDNIGRGGRKLIYFKDESAHYEHPEMIEAALSDNTRVQVDISSVNGLGNVFHRRRLNGAVWEGDVEPGSVQVFVMDWRDHPEKTQEWYDERRRLAEGEGMMHIFAQEVDRDYSSAVEGILIPGEHVTAAIDAHIALGFEAEGESVLGFDVADEGGDKNALIGRKGVVVGWSKVWGQGDPVRNTNEAFLACREQKATRLVYDSVGVGAGVKGQIRVLEKETPGGTGIHTTGFNGGGKLAHPDRNFMEGKKNKDMFANPKAQGWWGLRLRFQKTFDARMKEGVEYDPSELISLDSKMASITELQSELSQPTHSFNGAGKMLVDKAPSGTKSPNMADALMMCFVEAPAGPRILF